MNRRNGISGSSALLSILIRTARAIMPITNPVRIIGFVHPIVVPKFRARRIPQRVITSAMIPGTSILTLPSRFTFGMFIPINTTPRRRGSDGIMIAILRNPISVKIPAMILPPNPPTAIAVASIPIAFGTSFLSLIRPTRMYGAAVKAP